MSSLRAPRLRRGAALVAVLALVATACGNPELGAVWGVDDTSEPVVAAPTDTQAGPEPVVADTAAPSETGVVDTATTTTAAPEELQPLQSLTVEPVVADLSTPVFLTAPEGDDRLFIIEKPGKIRIVDSAGTLLETPFLDIRERIGADSIEQGLLGMAFHPDYGANGRFFVYYTAPSNDATIVEFATSPDPNVADIDSAEVLIEIEEPDVRHNAGMMQFGPDGLLYIAVGDGGAGSTRNAQKPENMLGSMLRIDVDGGDPYAIPPTNPYVDGVAGAPEVLHYGLRNPWRFSIDYETELIYIGDVGQAVWEEVDVVSIDEAGLNFGWHFAEGNGCFGLDGCDPADYVVPAVAYTHSDGECSVTGGYVYRGELIPEIDGVYFYADWCKGFVKSFRYVDGEATDERDWSSQLGDLGSINSFGVDGFGEMYVVSHDGRVGRIVALR
jgi:glucose/arabinose dehydrogenase